MASTRTKIPAGLQEFTNGISIEQLKKVEEAIKEQNAAIDNLSNRLEDAISSINKQKPQTPEWMSKEELETAVDGYCSDFTRKFEYIIKNYLASFRSEVTTLRKERQAEHQKLVEQRERQHKVIIRTLIAIPTAALLILFSSCYLHYRNSSVYWGNRAYNAAKAAGAQNPGMYYQFVQDNFADSLRNSTKSEVKRIEKGEYKVQKNN